LWSDTRASQDFHFPVKDAEAIASRIEAASLRARLALCTALFELIAARFEDLHDDPYPARFLEASWISLADRRYAHYDECRRSDWLGPIRAPLWSGLTWLGPALHFSDNDPSEWQSAVAYLVRLAYHVIPVRDRLMEWLEGSIARILQYHPAVVTPPLDDLFGRYAEWRRGPYVTSACFDLAETYMPEREYARMLKQLSSVQWDANPLLKSPAELTAPQDATEEPLPGVPYQSLPKYEELRPAS
jgi:hypothetical protein